MEKISRADEYQLRILRDNVDRLDEQRLTNSNDPNVTGQAAVARSELQEFVSKLRKKGVNI